MCVLTKLVQFCILPLQMEVGKECGKAQVDLLLTAIMLIIALMITFVENGVILLH